VINKVSFATGLKDVLSTSALMTSNLSLKDPGKGAGSTGLEGSTFLGLFQNSNKAR